MLVHLLKLLHSILFTSNWYYCLFAIFNSVNFSLKLIPFVFELDYFFLRSVYFSFIFHVILKRWKLKLLIVIFSVYVLIDLLWFIFGWWIPNVNSFLLVESFSSYSEVLKAHSGLVIEHIIVGLPIFEIMWSSLKTLPQAFVILHPFDWFADLSILLFLLFIAIFGCWSADGRPINGLKSLLLFVVIIIRKLQCRMLSDFWRWWSEINLTLLLILLVDLSFGPFMQFLLFSFKLHEIGSIDF